MLYGVSGRAKSILFALFLVFSQVGAAEDFIVKNISVTGLQRVSVGTVLNYLPLKVGDLVTSDKAAEAIRSLYKTGFFADIQLYQKADVLIIDVEERPAIASISISGNEGITSEVLEKALKEVGLAENRVFNRSLLDQMEQEIRRQYVSLGKYAVKIESRITTRERNRVDVAIIVTEGTSARITRINIIGNKVFDEKLLQSEFELTGPEFSTLFTDSDKYSKQKLQGDLEKLRSYYLDRGYIKFEILSTQVAISPDKENIYITVVINEGEQYSVKDVKLLGEMVVDEKELQGLVTVKSGEVFSRRLVTESSTAISDRLGDDGYAFANVNAVPDIDDTNKTVVLTYFIDPGNRVYVRRINISGNEETADDVIRRELRQLESGWFTPKKMNRSKIRLQRLGFFEDVAIETPAVPGTSDQVDVNVKVTEGSRGQLQAGVGYGDTSGLLLNANVVLNNFVGTGKRVSLEANKDDYRKNLQFSWTNPYYTDSGISRTLSVFYSSLDADKGDFGNYATDDTGARANYGFPLSEFNTARFGLEYKNSLLRLSQKKDLSSQECKDDSNSSNCQYLVPDSFRYWLNHDMNQFTERYNVVSMDVGWTRDTRNRTFLADNGYLQRFFMDVATPAGDLTYFKVGHDQEVNWELAEGWVFQVRTSLGYGQGYGKDSKELPFFERYRAGGTKSVRGYQSYSLGPRDARTGDVVGGDAKFVTNLELIFPFPFAENSKSFRVSTFVDTGTVRLLNKASRETIDPSISNKLRSAYGFSALWVSPIGVFSFNWGWPIGEEQGDKTKVFQWYIGAPF